MNIDDGRLIPNPKNPNDHSQSQLKQFSKILQYQGQRKPIIISKQTGFIITGHGTLMAAKLAGAKQIAVDLQDFDNEAMEYAHVVADNGIALQSELDLAAVNNEFVNLGPDFEIDLLGIDGFKLDLSEADLPDLGDGSDPDFQQRTFILSNEQNDILNEAMELAEKTLPIDDEINKNKNGNIISAIMKQYVYR